MRRFEPNALHGLEQHALDYFTKAHGFNEIQGYLWYDSAWLRQLEKALETMQLNHVAELIDPTSPVLVVPSGDYDARQRDDPRAHKRGHGGEQHEDQHNEGHDARHLAALVAVAEFAQRGEACLLARFLFAEALPLVVK